MSKHKFTLTEQTSFKDIVQQIDVNGVGFLAIVDPDDKLMGIVTDGDVRRCIIRDEVNLKSLINANPLFWPEGKSIKGVAVFMKNKKIKHLPLVDENKILKEVICFDDLAFDLKINPVVLMAGGLGTRLMPLTQDTPKPLLKVNGKPILHYLIESFVDVGFHEFYITVNYLKEKIMDYFGDGSNFGIKINYIIEEKRTGTAGSLFYLKNLIKQDFIVMNSDLVTDINMLNVLDYHIKNRNIATMCSKTRYYQVPFGVIETKEENKIESIKEKPSYNYEINAGIYILSPSIFEFIPNEDFLDMPDLFKLLIDRNLNVHKYNIDSTGNWFDIGSIEDFSYLSDNYQKYFQ